jgi:hypothetical protein
VTSTGVELDDPSALPRQVQMNSAIMLRLASVPGIVDVGGISRFPLSGGGANGMFLIVPPNDDEIEREPLGRLGALLKDTSRTGDARSRMSSASAWRRGTRRRRHLYGVQLVLGQAARATRLAPTDALRME